MKQLGGVVGLGSAKLRRWWVKLTEPYFLFPAIAIIVLGVIWSATIKLTNVERANAKQAAMALSKELGETYEARIVRALREIDQTLKLVKYEYELRRDPRVLENLKQKGLLLPNLLFAISIADGTGKVVASSPPSHITGVAESMFFRMQPKIDSLWIGQPERSTDSEEWKLNFRRRLSAADGTFAGIVTVTVDASFFVSDYDPSKLGEHGVLALLGTDGVFRARRTGESTFAGDSVDLASLEFGAAGEDARTFLAANPWDGIQRFTSVHQLHEFPLLVVAGLSKDEQLAGARRNIRAYRRRAVAGSVLLILVCALLGRTSWQLRQSRLRAFKSQVEHSERTEYLAYHDSLTGLPNRSLFSKLLQQNISEARRYEKEVAVLFLDLDRFKVINDTLGHEAGDELLKEVATRIKGCLRESDIVARLGGDEFVVMLPELNQEKHVAVVARKILAAVGQPFTLVGQEFRVTVSIGISTYPQHGLDEQTLTKNADIAMYRAKEEGKNNFQFYSDELNVYSVERIGLESSLRHALARNEFQLYYQAKRDLYSNRITGMEALLRWQHPDLGPIEPARFIPIAEETGIIVPIGKWVLKTVCLQNVAWQKSGLPSLPIAVNLTRRQFFDDHLLLDLASILEDADMEAGLLELEIAESVLMQDIEKAVRVLTQLKTLGVRMAIDGFGTGYSSLIALERFPIDTIKIDRSLLKESTLAKGADLTDAIIAMGKTLSMTVVAQGVETKQQADFLRAHAYDEFQGFYFHKPIPVDQFTQLLRTQTDVAEEAAPVS